MAVWLTKAGLDGQFEGEFLNDQRVYLTLDLLDGEDFTETPDYASIRKQLLEKHAGIDETDAANFADMVFEFVLMMNPKDFVLMPRKAAGTLAIGEITSTYGFDPSANAPFSQLRDVKWVTTDLPATVLSQGIQDYLAAPILLTQIKIADAAQQIQRALGPRPEMVLVPDISASTQIKPKQNTPAMPKPSEPAIAQVSTRVVTPTSSATVMTPDHKPADLGGESLESAALNAVSRLLAENIDSLGLETLILDILKAGGLKVIPLDDGNTASLFMVASGAFGLDRPKTCVHVHPSIDTCDALAFSQFFGTMQGFQADQGLLVSWGGFDAQVHQNARAQGAKISLWDRTNIISQFLAQYPLIHDRWHRRVPLKNVWIPDESL